MKGTADPADVRYFDVPEFPPALRKGKSAQLEIDTVSKSMLYQMAQIGHELREEEQKERAESPQLLSFLKGVNDRLGGGGGGSFIHEH